MWANIHPIYDVYSDIPSFVFLAGNQLYELKRHRIGWGGGGGPKKTIAIFVNKQSFLSMDMKTKVVHHVKIERMREWK